MSTIYKPSAERNFLRYLPAEEIVKKVFPKDFPMVEENAKSLRKAVQEIFEQRVSQGGIPISKLILPKGSAITGYIKRDEKEIRLLCFPKCMKDCQDPLSRSNGLQERLGAESVFSLDSGHFVSYLSHIDSGKEKLYDQEMQGRELLKEKVPLLYNRLPPLTRYSTGVDCLSSKGPFYKTIANELENNRFSLSASQILKILRQILFEIKALSSQGLVYCYLNPNAVSIQRCGDKVTGHLTEFMYLTSKKGDCKATHSWLNTLAYQNFASLDTDLNGLIQLMAVLFSLQFRPSTSWDVQKQEESALYEIQEHVFPRHYQKVLELKEAHKGFHKGFSRALLHYVDELKLQDEEGFQICVLEQFAEKMALFPQISSLLQRIIKVNKEHEERLLAGEDPAGIDARGPHLPSLKKIEKVLRQGEKALQELQGGRMKISTEILQVDKALIRQLVTEVSKQADLIEPHTDWLYDVINAYLQESPKVGDERRFHKDPFSFRICVGLKHICIYPIGGFLGGGHYKTAKKSWKARISTEEISITPQMLSRSRRKRPEELQIHHAILQIPEADKYFIDLPRRHMGYVGASGKMKWESNRSVYNNSLEEVIERQGVFLDPFHKETFHPLTMLDFISLLQNVACGLDLIAHHQISHGDIKSGNIGVFVGPDASCNARITDFDLSSYFSSQPANLPMDYLFWDARRKKFGEIGKNTDIYGLVLLIAEVFLCGLQEIFRFSLDASIYQMMEEICKNPEGFKEKFLHVQMHFLRKLHPDCIAPISKDTCSPICEKIIYWQNTQEHQKASALKNLLCKALCFDRIFSLLEQTLKADQASCQEGSEIPYPTMEAIERVLEECKQDVLWVEEQCKNTRRF